YYPAGYSVGIRMGESDEEILRKIRELRRDPAKWDAYIASRADKVLDNWPRRATRKHSKNSSKSS
ncbi:MAG: hypothetical protein OK449_08025, partial [Thaumarchaeota archaeon]|nr:hypothetical protein [Nitrososphaerota archaeon]